MSKIAIDFKTGLLKNDSKIVAGIDLGTTNSLIARMHEGKAEIIKDISGHPLFVPSVVFVDDAGRMLIGHEAKQKMATHPESTVYSVKRLMGKSLQDLTDRREHFGYQFDEEASYGLIRVRINEKFYTPVELSSFILKHLASEAERALGRSVEDVVITVPAYFNDEQRQATRDAGKMAGLNVLRIVNEPTAASLAFGIGLDRQKTATVAVYDLGGGTFDVSILRIEDGIFDVLSTRGDTHLGGDDFDREIVRHWISHHGISYPQKEEVTELLLLAQKAKHQLTENAVTSVTWKNHEFFLSKEDFKSMTEHLVRRTLDCFRLALADSGMQIHDLDDLILVGGSTRMPVIIEALQDFFGRMPNRSLDPDEAVALGAAIQADILAGNRKDLLLLDVNPLSLGIETLGGLMDVIIPRNSKIPIHQAREYTTSKDGQKNLKISVYQGERDLVENNKLLGEFVLAGIPPMAAGIPKVRVSFMIDADGILTVKAMELRTNTEQSISIRSQFNLTTEQVAGMLSESIKFAKQDMEKKALIDSINEGRHLLLSGEKFLNANQSQLKQKEIKEINTLMSHLRSAIESGIRDHIELAIEALNRFTTPLAHAALDRNIAEALKDRRVIDGIQNEIIQNDQETEQPV